MSTNAFSYLHRVGYADCTLGNHVYYSRYLDFIEVGRGEFFRQIGKPLAQLQEENVIFPVIEVRARYHAPARYDELLEIKLFVIRLDRIRLGLAYKMFKESGLLVLEAETLHVCTSIAEKPQRIPEDLQLLLARFAVQPLPAGPT
jgi:acyl-CoA thioester hydrolase